MSTVICSLGRARNSSHVQDTESSTSPSMVNVHRSSGVCGVGPAERTGKSVVTYWPGGTRSRGASERARPRKPRETGDPPLIRRILVQNLVRLRPGDGCVYSHH